MTGFFSKAKLALLISSTIIFTGCSGDDGGGAATSINTAPAAIDITNAEAIGEAIQVADASNSVPTSGIPKPANENVSTGLSKTDNLFIDATNAALNTSTNLPTGVVMDVSAYTCSSGTASMSTTGTTAAADTTMTFNSCTLIGNAITATGTFVMHYDNLGDPNAAFSFTYTNFTIYDAATGTTVTMNMSMDCPTGINSCTFSSDFTGADGVTHSVSNFSFSGDATFGFSGTATFSHGTYGSVSITATGITYGSCDSYPDGGTVSFSSSDGSSGTVTFNSDCTVSGTWNNGTASGSF